MQTFSDNETKLAFFDACERARTYAPGSGIGTLREKQLHSAVKFFVDGDPAHHEVRVGRSVADVKNERGIFEVQTGAFGVMRKKLSVFLEDNEVTIVHPVANRKRLFNMDEKTGEVSAPRLSPKRGNSFDIFYELYSLSELAWNKNLHILVLLIDMDEYRLLGERRVGGRKSRKGYTRFDRLPVSLERAEYFASPRDYIDLLPASLPESFTSRNLAEAAKIRLDAAQTALTVLSRMGAVEQTGRSGRYKAYSIVKAD